MTSSILRPRRLAVAVAASVLVGGAVVFAVTHERSPSAEADGTSPGGAYCWGTLPAETLDRLVRAPGPGGAPDTGQAPGYREVSGKLDYPRSADERCAIHLVSAVSDSVLPVVEFALHGTYQDLQRPEWFGARAVVSVPLGEDLYGAASADQAWASLPNCRSDTGRFAQLVVHDQDPAHRVGRRALLAETLVAMTNSVRAKAGCTGPVLPSPEPRPDPPPRPYRPQTLCGVALPGPLPGGRPAWTERWTGADRKREDCLVADGDAPDPPPVIRVETYRDLPANLEIGERSGVETAGVPQVNVFSYGSTATYWAVCANGPVTYLVGVKDGEGLPAAQQLLAAFVAGNAARDGCAPPAPTPG
jgi:hypothetical protein